MTSISGDFVEQDIEDLYAEDLPERDHALQQEEPVLEPEQAPTEPVLVETEPVTIDIILCSTYSVSSSEDCLKVTLYKDGSMLSFYLHTYAGQSLHFDLDSGRLSDLCTKGVIVSLPDYLDGTLVNLSNIERNSCVSRGLNGMEIRPANRVAITSLALDYAEYASYVGTSFSLDVQVQPTDATEPYNFSYDPNCLELNTRVRPPPEFVIMTCRASTVTVQNATGRINASVKVIGIEPAGLRSVTISGLPTAPVTLGQLVPLKLVAIPNSVSYKAKYTCSPNCRVIANTDTDTDTVTLETLAPGQCTVSVLSTPDEHAYSPCCVPLETTGTFNVITPIKCTGINIPKTSILRTGESLTLTPSLKPPGCQQWPLVWNIGNQIAQVTVSGESCIIKAITPGQLSLSVCASGSGLAAAPVNVNIKQGPSTEPKVAKTRARRGRGGSERELDAGDCKPFLELGPNLSTYPNASVSLSLTSKDLPSGAIFVTDKNCIEITDDGAIVGVMPGTARVYVKDQLTGEALSKPVTVSVLPITIRIQSLTLEDDKTVAKTRKPKKGEPPLQLPNANAPTIVDTNTSKALRTKVTPLNASCKTLVYSSSDPVVATVSLEGVIAFLSEGEVTIFVRTADGSRLQQSRTYKVVRPITDLQVYVRSMSVGEHVVVGAHISPLDATCQDLLWTIKGNCVKELDCGGGSAVKVLLADNVGSCTVTARAHNGKTGSCTFTIGQPVQELKINAKIKPVTVGALVKLSYTVSPVTTSTTLIQWTSSDDQVATVSAGGLVTGCSSGTVIITGTCLDRGSGIISDSVVIRVL